MSNIDNSHIPDNNECRNNITIELDDEVEHEVAPVSLGTENGRSELRRLFSSAQRIVLGRWENVVNLPSEIADFLIEITTSDEFPNVAISVSGQRPRFADPFEATMALTVDRTNLHVIGNATKLAVTAAAAVCPGAAPHAARQIKEWLQQYQIESDTVSRIAARIRRESSVSAESERASPQEAARQVLGRMQEEREIRGEDTSTSPPVRFYQNEHYVWNGNRWQTDADFPHTVVEQLQLATSDKDITTNFSNSVLRNIEAMTLLPRRPDSLPWRVQGSPPTTHPVKVVSFANGYLDLNSVSDSSCPARLMPHDSQIFGAPKLEYPFDASANCPLWIETLGQIFPTLNADDNRNEVVQEFFGYCLAPWNHRFEMFMIMIGDGANGKSVVLDVLRAMLGKSNVSDVPLDAFGSEFRVADMFGKLANIGTDMQRMQRVQEGLLKQLVSGEPFQVNRKYKPPITMYPTAKMIFATNYLPPFGDTSDGLWRRMIVVPFNERFTEANRDLHRARQITAGELPGVFNWAIAGLRRLLTQGHFTVCEICNDAKIGHRHESDPFAQFIDECCDLEPRQIELVASVYKAYRGFCEAIGKKPKAKSEIGKQLSRLSIEKERLAHGRRPYVYRGIKLRDGVLSSRPTSECYQAPRPHEVRAVTRTRPTINRNSVSPGPPLPSNIVLGRPNTQDSI